VSPDNGRGEPGQGARWLRAGLQASTIGLTLVIATVIGFFFGLGLDHLFHTSFENPWGVGWLTLVGTLLGVIAGFREMVRTVIRISEDQDRSDQ
jgi:F0F1-type ATP synthase assembly protein I